MHAKSRAHVGCVSVCGGSNGAPCSLDGLDLNRFAGPFVKLAAIDLDQACCLLMDRCSERRNRLGQIVSGVLLQALRDGWRRVNLCAIQKTLQHGAALDRVDLWRHPCVFGADLACVLGKARSGRAQDGQVDVDQQRLVRRGGQGGVAGGHDQVMHALAAGRIDTARRQGLGRPVRRACFVIVALHVVDGIVEPQSQLDIGRLFGMRTQRAEQRQAFVEVLQCVVVALGFVPRAQQLLAQSGGRGQVQGCPGCKPARGQQVHGYIKITSEGQ
jgi:hypothetical protein